MAPGGKLPKIVAAVVFVAGLGVVLAIPIIRGWNGIPAAAHRRHHAKPHKSLAPPPFPSESPTPSPTPTPTPTPAPSPKPSPSPGGFVEVAGPFRQFELTGEYPESCLGAVARPRATGLLAGFNGTLTSAGSHGRLTVRAIGGGGEETFAAQAPFQWSASGRYLATDHGSIVTRDGTGVGTFEGDAWGWSPSADCLISTPFDPPALMVTTPEGESTVLLERNVTGFSVSPDGTHVGLALAHGPRSQDVWIADLETGEVREVDRAPRDLWYATLGPWSKDGARLYYWRPDSLLRSVTTSAPVNRVVYAPSKHTRGSEMPNDDDALIECGGDLIGVVRPGGSSNRRGRLAVMNANAAPDLLTTSSDFVYWKPQCSPDGFYVAAIRAPAGSEGSGGELVIFDRDGNLLQSITPGGSEDSDPIWGPAGTGLLFVRRTGSDPAEVWYATEGSSPQGTGLTISDDYEPYVRKYGYEWLLDWSATPPDGLPTG
jgi:hypothetical protein